MPFNFKDIRLGVGYTENPVNASVIIGMVVVVILMWVFWDCSCGGVKGRILKASISITALMLIALHYNTILSRKKVGGSIESETLDELLSPANYEL